MGSAFACLISPVLSANATKTSFTKTKNATSAPKTAYSAQIQNNAQNALMALMRLKEYAKNNNENIT